MLSEIYRILWRGSGRGLIQVLSIGELEENQKKKNSVGIVGILAKIEAGTCRINVPIILFGEHNYFYKYTIHYKFVTRFGLSVIIRYYHNLH
jgi:hypothetical protein